jgi:hypothetical protein
MTEPAKPRPRPCASCPYRCDVPSGVWQASEYRLLERYDGPTGEQPANPFFCHQGDNHLCSGWVGHKEPYDLLAVRLGISFGAVDPSTLDYTTDVPLFESGRDAAEHGMEDIDWPGPEAQAMIEKIKRVRSLPGREPLTNG